MHRGSLCPKCRRNRVASHCSVPSSPHAAHSHFSYFLLTFPVIWSAKPPRRGSALGGSWLLHSFCYWRRAPHGIASHTRTNPHTRRSEQRGSWIPRHWSAEGTPHIDPERSKSTAAGRTACGLVRVLQACDPCIATRRAKKNKKAVVHSNKKRMDP